MDISVIEGQELARIVPEQAKTIDTEAGSVNITFHGQNGCDMNDTFSMSQSLLSQHLLVVGGIGSGKTNALNLGLEVLTGKNNARNKLSGNDVMVIFDTKGDFKAEFYRPGDIVISNGSDACGASGRDYWNIVSELRDATPDDKSHLKENIIEITNALFAERLKKGDDPFFPAAAKELVGALLYHAVQIRRVTPRIVNNAFVLQLINEPPEKLHEILDKYSDYKYVKAYIPEDSYDQTNGVIAEMRQVMQPLLIGNFCRPGNISIRDLVRAKGGRRIFIEYDIGVGSMLTPIYALLFDLAIKEALCRSHSEGNVFMIADEFKLLPNLLHIDDAVNFGRSLGIKFMVGIQNVDQIIDIYGENRAKNIFSGFMSHFAFSVSDYNTRKYIKERAGENHKCFELSGYEVYRNISKANVVEDWDIQQLGLGECIVMLNRVQPFVFHFKKYEPVPVRR